MNTSAIPSAPPQQRLTVREAQRLITGTRKKWIFLACSQFAGHTEWHHDRGCNVDAHVKVTRKAARQYLDQAYWARDALRVIVYEYPDYIFIGSSCP